MVFFFFYSFQCEVCTVLDDCKPISIDSVCGTSDRSDFVKCKRQEIYTSFVLQVDYRVITDGTTGIVRVLARAVLATITVPATGAARFTQTFSSSFEAVRSYEFSYIIVVFLVVQR